MTPHKDRQIFLLELLNSETDEENPITVVEIIDRLNAEGFTAARKTLATDIDTLWRMVSMLYAIKVARTNTSSATARLNFLS